MITSELIDLWLDFSNIPINEHDEIEEDFYLWEKGTDRFSIWSWFDDKLPNGLVANFLVGA